MRQKVRFFHIKAHSMDLIISLDEHVEMKQTIHDRGSNLSKRPHSRLSIF